MKKLTAIIAVLLVAVAVTSCGPHLYSTASMGKDNVSYVTVLTEGTKYDNVTVVVDGQVNPYGKVYKVKFKRKARPVVIAPGKHKIEVVADGQLMASEDIYIGLQETKQIIIK